MMMMMIMPIWVIHFYKFIILFSFTHFFYLGSYSGTYLAVLVIALPFISHVLDCFGIVNNIVYRLGDKAHYNFMKHLLVTREIDKHKQEDPTFNQGEYAPNEAVVTSEEAAEIKKRASVHIESQKDCCGNDKRCCGQKQQIHEYDPKQSFYYCNVRIITRSSIFKI